MSTRNETFIPPAGEGFRGVWYSCGTAPEPYLFKYSGGLGTYPQQVLPIAVHSPEVERTYFVYGGAASDGNVQNMFSWLEHSTGQVRRPVVLRERDTNDAHFNASLAVDDEGYIYVFANSHGRGPGGESLGVRTPLGRSLILRSGDPHDPTTFDVVRDDNFSYSQPWPRPGGGLLWLHTRYQPGPEGNRRVLYIAASDEGIEGLEPIPLVDHQRGSYQVSWSDGDRVVTAFDVHPHEGGLSARSGVHMLEMDLRTLATLGANGQPVPTPVADLDDVLVRQHAGSLVFLKDIAFDADGGIAILYLTTRGANPGPGSGDRIWRIVHRPARDSRWRDLVVGSSDHNYDHGILRIDGSTWTVTAPLEPGPQPHSTGGTAVTRVSADAGETWETVSRVPTAVVNHTYIRKPYRASTDFTALWADGHALTPSPSSLYLSTLDGTTFRLPTSVAGEWVKPRELVFDKDHDQDSGR